MKYNLLLEYNCESKIVCQSNSKNVLVKELENRQGLIRMFNMENPYRIVGRLFSPSNGERTTSL